MLARGVQDDRSGGFSQQAELAHHGVAVIDVRHLDAVVSKFCLLTETATSIILHPAREHQPMLPPRREDVKPPIRKVTTA